MSSIGSKICFDKSRYVIYQPYPGLHLAYHAKRFILSRKSKYQQIDIIDNDAYGRTLFLDKNLQHTEYDAEIFNEALCGPAKRERIHTAIVLGGGSGQTVRALLQSKNIEHVTVAEIDAVLVESCKRYIKGMKLAFDDPRVKVRICDAFTYLHATTERFDAAIIDLTEKPLRIKSEYSTLKRAYADIKAKCKGRCSQYIGSTVALANTPLRKVARELTKKVLSRVRFEDVFIPSFGAPHTFIHTGYKRQNGISSLDGK